MFVSQNTTFFHSRQLMQTKTTRTPAFWDTPPPHDHPYWRFTSDPSQNKTKSKWQIYKTRQKINGSNQNCRRYRADPGCGRDGRSETNMPHKFVVRGYKKSSTKWRPFCLSLFGLNSLGCLLSDPSPSHCQTNELCKWPTRFAADIFKTDILPIGIKLGLGCVTKSPNWHIVSIS